MTLRRSAQLNWALVILLTALTYTGLGKLGLLLAIPPGFASPIFPPSGIALAVLLIFGQRYWPGIFLGSFLMNVSRMNAVLENTTRGDILVSLGIAGGASLQAVLGCLLICRFLPLPLNLMKPKEILLFMGLGGAVSCLLNALVGPLLLMRAAFIPAEHYFANSLMWWIGDTLGVLVFSPIVLALLGQPQKIWKRRRLTVALPLLLLFVTVNLFYVSFSKLQQNALENDFRSQVNALTHLIKRNFDRYSMAVLSTERFLTISKDVTQKQFADFVTPYLEGQSDIRVLSWIQRVSASERSAYEKAMKKTITHHSKIYDPFSENVPPPYEKTEYFPVTYVEPRKPNQVALAFDVASEPIRKALLIKARDRGKFQVGFLSHRLRSATSTPTLLLAQPVFKEGTPEDQASRVKNLRGFVTTGLRFEDLFAPAFLPPFEGLQLTVDGRDESGQSQTIAIYNRKKGTFEFERGKSQKKLVWNQELPLGDYTLHLQFTPNAQFITSLGAGTVEIFMILGLLFSALMCAFLLTATGSKLEVANLALELRQLADCMPQIVWTANRYGSVDFLNERWIRYTGMTLENLNCSRLVHPNDRDEIMRRWKEAVASLDNFEMEYRLLGKDGEYRWHLARALPLRDANSGHIRWFGSSTDVHDQRRRTEELQAANVYLELTHDAAQVGTWEWDVENHVLTRTPYHDRMYGFSEKIPQWSVDTFLERVHPDDRQKVREAVSQSQDAGGQGYDMEYRIVWPDESIHWISFKARFIRNAEGKVIKHIGTIFDITHIRDSQQQQALLAARESAALESARLKGEFLATMSHEIRTPINGVLGMTYLILNTDLSEEQRTYAEAIQQSGEALLTVINDILDFSKIEAGKLEFVMRPFALRKTIEDSIHVVAPIMERKGLSFTLSLAEDLPLYLKGDAGRLRQVLLNLLSNAVKFTAKGSVNMRVTRESAPEAEGRLRFEVEDTGPGISLQDQSKLFEDFSQISGSTTQNLGGSGLGLSISKKLVQKMNGDIGVVSQEGKGSIFWFTLGLEELFALEEDTYPAEEVIKAEVPPRFARRFKVLLAEDVYLNQVIASKLLEVLGANIEIATNGQEVLKRVSEQDFDLILMDCQMPLMDGYEATKHIRSATGTRSQRVPIVAMTAYAMKGDEEKCLAAGMNDYLAKPIKPAALYAIVKKWVPDLEDSELSSHAAERLRRTEKEKKEAVLNPTPLFPWKQRLTGRDLRPKADL